MKPKNRSILCAILAALFAAVLIGAAWADSGQQTKMGDSRDRQTKQEAKQQPREEAKTEARAEPQQDTKHQPRDEGRQVSSQEPAQEARDAARQVSARESAQEARDTARQANGRDAAQEARDAARQVNARESAQEARDTARQANGQAAAQEARDAARQASERDAVRDARDAARQVGARGRESSQEPRVEPRQTGQPPRQNPQAQPRVHPTGQDPRPYNERSMDPLPFTGRIGNSIPDGQTYRGKHDFGQPKYLRDRSNWNDGRLEKGRSYVAPSRGVFHNRPIHRNERYYYDSGWTYQDRFACSFGDWVFSNNVGHSRRSAYYHYGLFPYVSDSIVIILSNRPHVTYAGVPIVVRIGGSYGSGYYLDRPSASSIDAALSDIRSAWLDNDADLIVKHVRSDTRIDVNLDGSYSYTLESEDYRAMTRDAIAATQTISFEFDNVSRRGDGSVMALGKHVFYNGNGERTVAYVSYLLEKKWSQWSIIEVGSSLTRR